MISGRKNKPYLLAFTFHQRFHTLHCITLQYITIHDPHDPVFVSRLQCHEKSQAEVWWILLWKGPSPPQHEWSFQINRSCLSLGLHKKDTCLFWKEYVFLVGNHWLILFPFFYRRRRHRSFHLSGVRGTPSSCRIECQNICQKRCQRRQKSIM